MSDAIWAITAYFNPMHWRRRRENFRVFRQQLRIPLVAVELGYDGCFDLEPGDADILLRFPAADVMWQKERLLNLALAAVPPEVERIAALDGDVIFDDADGRVWPEVCRAVDATPIVQCFSHVYYLPADHVLDFNLIERTQPACEGFGWLRAQGRTTLELCNPDWRNPHDLPPVSYGLAWACRRELVAERGFYDAWVIGGGTRVHCFASDGLWRECADAMQFTPPMREHYRRWAEGFHADVGGAWGCVPGAVAHLWHGSMGGKKFRQRYRDFAEFGFDPHADVAVDGNNAWRWSSPKPAMHDYVRTYFAGRQEDGEAAPPQPTDSRATTPSGAMPTCSLRGQ
jgi:hypothetical protein